jgi:hypothetical protein
MAELSSAKGIALRPQPLEKARLDDELFPDPRPRGGKPDAGAEVTLETVLQQIAALMQEPSELPQPALVPVRRLEAKREAPPPPLEPERMPPQRSRAGSSLSALGFVLLGAALASAGFYGLQPGSLWPVREQGASEAANPRPPAPAAAEAPSVREHANELADAAMLAPPAATVQMPSLAGAPAATATPGGEKTAPAESIDGTAASPSEPTARALAALEPADGAAAPLAESVAETPISAPAAAAPVVSAAPEGAVATLEPVAAPPPRAAERARPAELAALVQRGNEMLAVGDIVSARRFFERAAAAGDAAAACGLAKTYDPLFLRQIGTLGVKEDAAKAADWYRKAAAGGNAEAVLKLERLVGKRAR